MARKNLPIILYTIVLAAVYLSYNKNDYYLPTSPGFFLLQSMALLLLLFWAGRSSVRFSIALPSGPLAGLVLFGLWAIVGSFWCAAPWIVAEGIRRILTALLLTLGLSYSYYCCPDLRKKAWPGAVAVFTLITLAYIALWLLPPQGSSASYFFGNPNLAGAVFAFFAAFSLTQVYYFFSDDDKKTAMIYGVLSILFIGALLLSRCKGATLALGLIIFTLSIVWLWHRNIRYAVFFSLAAISTTIATIVFLPEHIKQRLWPSLEIRLYLWQGAYRMISADFWHFLAGWGPGNFFAVYPDYSDPKIYSAHSQAPVTELPHNLSLEILVEHGLLGWLLAIAILGYSIRIARSLHQSAKEKKEKAQIIGAIIAIAVILLHSQVSVALSYSHIQLLPALALAWLFCSKWREFSIDGKLKRIAIFISTILLLFATTIAWKYCAWDSLRFHYQYKKSRSWFRWYDQMEKSGANEQQLEKARAVVIGQLTEKLAAVDSPLCQNSYTCHWRNSLGRSLIDSFRARPDLHHKAIPVFLHQEKLMPRYGFFLLNRAMLAVKQGKKKEVDHYFSLFSEHNPFSVHLWNLWGIACFNQEASAAIMENKCRKFLKNYGRDGALLYGWALVLEKKEKIDEAQKIMEEAIMWCRNQKYNKRANDLEEKIKNWQRENY